MINLPIFYRSLQFSIQDLLKIIICIKKLHVYKLHV